MLAVLAGCGGRPAAALSGARVAIAARIVVPPCDSRGPRQVPLRLAVLLTGGGRRVRVVTRAHGDATVRLVPGRYAVAPVRPALRDAVVAVRFDTSAAAASGGRHGVNVVGGRHRVLLLVGLHPLECNGRAPAG